MEIFCRHLDRSRFEVFAVCKRQSEPLGRRLRIALGAAIGLASAASKKRIREQAHARLPNFRAILGEDHVLVARDDEELRDSLLTLRPDILHVHYSGRPEPPTSDEALMSRIPVTITTNAFEIENTAPAHRFVKRMYFVSRWMLENRAQWAASDPRAEVFYNPIEGPVTSENLRERLGIPRDAFVIGRVGRADPGIHDPISLKAYREIQSEGTWFLALSAPPNMVREARELGLVNFAALAPTVDDFELSRFYNTIDVLAHARRDGETFGCNLAEAMIHGKPVVSHFTEYMNAQAETIGEGGVVVPRNDWREYALWLGRFRENPALRAGTGEKAKQRALGNFEARRLTDRLADAYLALSAGQPT